MPIHKWHDFNIYNMLYYDLEEMEKHMYALCEHNRTTNSDKEKNI
jgi:hypothetical protein